MTADTDVLHWIDDARKKRYAEIKLLASNPHKIAAYHALMKQADEMAARPGLSKRTRAEVMVVHAEARGQLSSFEDRKANGIGYLRELQQAVAIDGSDPLALTLYGRVLLGMSKSWTPNVILRKFTGVDVKPECKRVSSLLVGAQAELQSDAALMLLLAKNLGKYAGNSSAVDLANAKLDNLPADAVAEATQTLANDQNKAKELDREMDRAR